MNLQTPSFLETFNELLTLVCCGVYYLFYCTVATLVFQFD